MVLLCKEIRETLIDLTVENRLTLREFKTVGCGNFFYWLLEGFFCFFIGKFFKVLLEG